MSGVMNPGQRDTSLLTTVMKGLQIARDIYGIKVDSEKLDMMKAEQERQQQVADETKAEKERLAAGKFKPGERGDLMAKGGYVPAKDGEDGAFQIGSDEQGLPFFVKKYQKPTITPPVTKQVGNQIVQQDPKTGAWVPVYTAPKAAGSEKLVQVETVDDAGNPVTKFVTPSTGLTVPKAPAANNAAKKSENETNYRYESLKQNAEKLRKLVEDHGTVEVTGPVGDQMDSLVYNMAVDYAKLVDPDSIAREGEVAAAQKYLLPFRQSFLGIGPKGMGTSNDTAVTQIDNYISGLDDRLAARAKSYNTQLPEGFAQHRKEASGGDGEAIAAPVPQGPKKGEVVDGYEFLGGDPADQWNWRKVGGK